MNIQEARAGWQKSPANPVLGAGLGTCFDIALLKEGPLFRMWFSWRPRRSIALVESTDGIHWSEPVICLGPAATGWEEEVNRPSVVKQGDVYHLWYTGQAAGKSWIGHALSTDGKSFTRTDAHPILSAELAWEGVAVMCPQVLWDEELQQYRMWYSGGEQYEPDAIGYATSADGLTWSKHPGNPVFAANAEQKWEAHKVTAGQVLRHGGWHLMFYIGFRDVNHAQIGIARSRDGITGWQRHPANPILSPASDLLGWDHDADYKPFVIFDDGRWYLWYNGRREHVEQIGMALHEGEDLGFED